ncbi:MAG: hypothetical protein WC791_00980 [Candidatus Paceibacterota bacterium]|jgi:hypothetical protein
MIKKIIIGIVAVILLALLGRLGWAYVEVKKDIAREAAVQSAQLAATKKAEEEEARAAALLASIPKAPEGCPEAKQSEEVWVTGRVVFPKGIKATSTYSVTSNLVTYPINPDGTFCAISTAGQNTLITASATTTNSFVLSAVFNTNIDDQDFLINASSTAIALVYNNPLVSSGTDPDILNTIATNSAVIKFASSISTAGTLTSKDMLAGGKLATTYNTAVKAAQQKATTTVPVSQPKPIVQPTPSPTAESTPGI